MRDQKARRASLEFFEAMLYAVTADGCFQLEIAFVEDWTVHWPRPPFVATNVILQVDSAGRFSLAPWVEAVQVAIGPESRCGAMWLRCLQQTLGEATLGGLLSTSASAPKLRGLYLQLIWQVGLQLQAAFRLSLSGKTVVGLSASYWHLADVLEQPHQLDRHLARYLMASRQACAGVQNLSICTDKSTVCGLTLQNSAVILPNNTAVICPPQVCCAPDRPPFGSASRARPPAGFLCRRIVSRDVFWGSKLTTVSKNGIT